MNKQKIGGFTLVEIMVALAIGALLMSGIIQVFFSLKTTTKMSASLSRMQESARTATDLLTYDAKLVNFQGCIDSAQQDTMEIIANKAPIDGTYFMDSALLGFEVTGTGWGDSFGLGDIDGSGAKNARKNSSVFRVQHISSANMPLIADMGSKSGAITVEKNTLGLDDGDFAVAADCWIASLFMVTGKTEASDKVTFTHSATSNASADLAAAYTSKSGYLSRFVSNTYFVGDTGRKNVNGDAIYALFQRDIKGNIEEVVEGVEYMRVLYGHEFSTGNIRFVDASDADLKMRNVTAIKIALLISSNSRILEEPDTTQYQLLDTAIANTGTTITYPNDYRLRRVVNMTAKIRNRRI